MRNEILNILVCPACSASSWELSARETTQLEVKSGLINCRACHAAYPVRQGIIDFLHHASAGALRERTAMDQDDYITDELGQKFKINAQAIDKFRDKFLALPEGDGSAFFKKGGSFQTTAEASGRFYAALKELRLSGKEKILEIGACFSYASFKFAQQGATVVALDISNYLEVSSLYVEKAYFERIFSDMHHLPFADGSFDIVFGSAVLHHSKDLPGIFSQIHRVLKPGGKLVLINESGRGVWERVHPVYQELAEKGFGDTAYTLPEWSKGAKAGGLKKVKIIFSSLADDYIAKHKNRGTPVTFKVRLAYFFKKYRNLENFILWFTILPRMFTRPKSWRLIGYK